MRIKKVKYGSYENDMWHKLNGLASVQHVIDRIWLETNMEDYKLFAVGTILNNIDTYDIDLILIGPLELNRINAILDSIVRISYDEQINCDIKYSVTGELYDPQVDNTKTIRYAFYRPYSIVNGVLNTFATEAHGLYLKDYTWPSAKNKNRDINYKSPVQVI